MHCAKNHTHMYAHISLCVRIYHAFFQNAQTVVFMQLQSGPPLDEMSMACILRDLLHAIEYLHNEGKIHRDIKGFLSLIST